MLFRSQMSSLLLTFAVACAASLLLTPLVRRVALRCGVLDRPDGKRKLHGRPVPLWGGAAVYLALVVGLLAARYGAFGNGPELDRLALLLAFSAGFVCLFGGLDDARHLSSRLKLLLQTCAVLPMVFLGWVDRVVLFGIPIELGWIGIPLTAFWLVGCINEIGRAHV